MADTRETLHNQENKLSTQLGWGRQGSRGATGPGPGAEISVLVLRPPSWASLLSLLSLLSPHKVKSVSHIFSQLSFSAWPPHTARSSHGSHQHLHPPPPVIIIQYFQSSSYHSTLQVCPQCRRRLLGVCPLRSVHLWCLLSPQQLQERNSAEK